MYLSSFLFTFFFSVIFNSCLAARPVSCKSASLFNGIFPPAFIGFNRNGNLDTSFVRRSAQLLCDSGVNGVLVNAAITGALELTVAETKRNLAAWVGAANICDLTIISQIGGLPFKDILDLARYSRKLNVPAVAIIPDPLYEQNDTMSLVEYTAVVAKQAYPKKVFLYDSPEIGLSFNIGKYLGRALDVIPNMGGVKVDITSALQIQSAIEPSSKYSILVADSFNAVAPFEFGLNGTSSVSDIIFPKWVVKIQQYVENGDTTSAVKLQKKVNKIIGSCLALLGDEIMDKSVYRYKVLVLRLIHNLVTGIDTGVPPSPPFPRLSNSLRQQIKSTLRRLGAI